MRIDWVCDSSRASRGYWTRCFVSRCNTLRVELQTVTCLACFHQFLLRGWCLATTISFAFPTHKNLHIPILKAHHPPRVDLQFSAAKSRKERRTSGNGRLWWVLLRWQGWNETSPYEPLRKRSEGIRRRGDVTCDKECPGLYINWNWGSSRSTAPRILRGVQAPLLPSSWFARRPPLDVTELRPSQGLWGIAPRETMKVPRNWTDTVG